MNESTLFKDNVVGIAAYLPTCIHILIMLLLYYFSITPHCSKKYSFSIGKYVNACTWSKYKT